MRRLRMKCAAADQIRFITLTRRMDNGPLGAVVDSLMRCWARLRKSRVWRSRVKGGVFVMEVTRGTEDRGWHVHLHVLADGTYFDQRELQTAWSEAVGDLAIANIKAVNSRHQAVRYVSGYLSKGTEFAEWRPEVIRDYAEGIHRKRMIDTFGTWRKLNVQEREERRGKKALPPHEVTASILEEAIDCVCSDRPAAWSLLSRMHWMFRRLVPRSLQGSVKQAGELDPVEWEECQWLLMRVHGYVESRAAAPLKVEGMKTPPLWDERQHHR